MPGGLGVGVLGNMAVSLNLQSSYCGSSEEGDFGSKVTYYFTTTTTT